MDQAQQTILVVDDTEANIDILVETLGDDYDVSVAMNGQDALDIVAEDPPDLILLDIMMPEMDGYEVCRRLKEDDAWREIPVIFISALSETGDEAKGLELGAIDYITKPFNPAIVLARVANHLTLREAVKMREDVERIMRHDLKSPLAAVITLPQLLLMDDNLDAEQRDTLKRIEDAGYTLLSMINLSTTLFKMERGTYELVPEAMDLAALMRKLFTGYEETAEMREVALSMTIEGAPVAPDAAFETPGEELLCHSMLGNLLGNALDAAPGGSTVSVDLAREGDGARLTIANQGEVPEDIRDRFFEKYATSGKTRGTGLGTYSARLIARAHGGDVTMDCSDGTVTVTVTLPDTAA